MLHSISFSKNDYLFFISSALLLAAGFLCMGLDPVENGFGVLTLWIAPLLLTAGFSLPILGVLGMNNLPKFFPVRDLSDSKFKHLAGLSIFIISLSVYIKTLEPTASLWDCSEFIAAAYKLQIPHTPGAPFFLLIGRIFTMFSFGNPENTAWTMNLMSALFSASTVYFLFYIIYHFGKRLTGSGSRFLPLIASACGSLCLAFSDTFWFSAVEAETYGAASFFLVFLIWMGLKSNQFDDNNLYSRWLILILYVAGLSFCIHPMCLLSLPAVIVTVFLKNRQLTFKNGLTAISLGFIVLMFINRFVSVGLFELAFSMDVFMVNTFGLPFHSGTILLVSVLVASFVFLLKKFPSLSSLAWVVLFLLIGFTPYLMLFIRSAHNPPMDEANPETLSMIKAYMNRESYGTRPLVYGQYFDARIDDINIKKKVYSKGEAKYDMAGNMLEYHYESSRSTLLPRIYSTKDEDIEIYRNWTGLRSGEKPTFIHNLKFMVKYQLGHMYFRYLMWNFAGRESDIQHARWLRPWEKLSVSGKSPVQNLARNQYWMAPFILGLLGLFFQYKKDKKGFFTTALFFLTTGLILALYLNSPPNEPRERDYIYVGSFMAYSIWIALGLLGITNSLMQRKFPSKSVHIVIFSVGFAIPVWMFYQNLDDHDRSGRTLQIDNARNILNSCAPNAILFTGGDNDTFPLWYLQEVEGFRTDIRVVVLSYFNTDWYINQLRKKYYDSEAFQFTLDPKDYQQYGPNDALYIKENKKIKGAIDAKKYLQLLTKEHPALKVNTQYGDSYHILPSRSLSINTDISELTRKLKLPAELTLSSEVILTTNQNYLEKNALAFTDILVSNHWSRPVYFNFTSINALGLNVKPYLVQEGQVFRFLPIENKENSIAINKSLTYKNLANADYSNLRNSDTYFNYEDYHLRIIVPVLQNFNTLATAYLADNNVKMAGKTLDYAIENLYKNYLIPSFAHLNAAKLLVALERPAEAKALCETAYNYYFDRVEIQIASGKDNPVDEFDFYLLNESANFLKHLGEDKYLSEIKRLITSL